MKRTGMAAGAALVAAALLFGACQPSGSSGPTQGGTLVVQLPGEIATTDSAFAQDSNTSYVLNQVVENLVGLKPGTIGELVPRLATAWTTSADGLTYTFEVRQGVKFHDGTALDAAAVCFNYNRWNNFTGALASGDYAYYYGAVFGGFGATSNLASCTASGTQAVIVLKKPYSAFLLSQTISTFAINSPAALAKLDADNVDPTKSPYGTGAAGAMNGTGPFMFKEWVPGDHTTIVKNPNYWDAANAAHLDAVTFKKIKDTTAVLNALQSGDIDLATLLNPVDIGTVKADTKLQVIERGKSCNLFHLAMNQLKPPFDNAKIREAVAYAVNKQKLVDTFYGGNTFASVAKTWMPPATDGWKDENLPTYDVAKAKAAIAASGLSGDQLNIEFHYPSDVFRPYMPDPKGIFESISSDLEAAGFKVTAATKPWTGGYLKEEATGTYPMWLIGWTCDWAGPDNFLDTAFFWHDAKGGNPEYAFNDQAFFDLVEQAKAQTTADAAKPLWEQAQDLIAKNLPTIPLVSSAPVAAAKATVKGFVGSGNLTELLNSVYITK
jgi:peptide/nickel transport system substrate-binding protein